MDEPISRLRVPAREQLPDEVRTLLDRAEAKLPFVPNVFHAFALTPEHFLRWFRYYDYLMRTDDSELSRAEREMIALVVSAENRCEYCLASHGAYLREVGGDHVTAEVLTHNYRRARLSARERAILDFAHALTTRSLEMDEADLAPLRAVGLTDEAIFEVAQVAAMFAFTNRLANALGWRPNPEFYAAHRS
jgi:uncharacterized peroxidase-related enzyme